MNDWPVDVMSKSKSGVESKLEIVHAASREAALICSKVTAGSIFSREECCSSIGVTPECVAIVSTIGDSCLLSWDSLADGPLVSLLIRTWIFTLTTFLLSLVNGDVASSSSGQSGPNELEYWRNQGGSSSWLTQILWVLAFLWRKLSLNIVDDSFGIESKHLRHLWKGTLSRRHCLEIRCYGFLRTSAMVAPRVPFPRICTLEKKLVIWYKGAILRVNFHRSFRMWISWGSGVQITSDMSGRIALMTFRCAANILSPF